MMPVKTTGISKYVYVQSTKHAPQTKADISVALLELLSKLDVHHEEPQLSVSDPSPSEQKPKEFMGRDQTDKQHTQPSVNSVKKQARKAAKQQKKAEFNESENKIATRSSRVPFWFEKYIWFISSDGYLVIAGRYSQQNALLFTRHLGEHDIIVGSDAPSSALVLVKNHLQTSIIPPSTLSQASTLAISFSTAWDTNGLVEAWFVRPVAFSIKTNIEQALAAESKEDFFCDITIDSKAKVTLGMPQLIMGYGIVFLVDEDSAVRHGKLRVDAISIESHEEEKEDSIEQNYEARKDEEDKYEFNGDLSNTVSSDKEESNDSSEEEKEDDDNDDDDESEESDGEMSTSSQSSSRVWPEPSIQSLPRGKKFKLKKISSKYADQDAEERALRMKLLGSEKSTAKQALDNARDVRRQEREQQARQAKIAEQEAVIKNRARRKEATETQRVPIRPDVLLANTEEEKNETVLRDRLIPRPSREDKIISAIPVCAPWHALHKFKYKVKILPGVGKRGKTLSKCRDFFKAGMGAPIDRQSTDISRAWPREIELIGKLTEEEVSLPVGIIKFRASIPSTKPQKPSSNQSIKKGKKGKK
ncbi:hypothetical protein V1514DRAFT_330887 [Lipomyces japonicus]|uniref:uncharacterized protein n=1 Tax=Lipomyces japonicus TaxID=56871 RepID=UPI0034CF07E2